MFCRRPDLEFINKQVDSGAIARLQQIAHTPFERVTYTRAIEILEEVVKSKKKKFEFPVSFCFLSAHLGYPMAQARDTHPKPWRIYLKGTVSSHAAHAHILTIIADSTCNSDVLF